MFVSQAVMDKSDFKNLKASLVKQSKAGKVIYPPRTCAQRSAAQRSAAQRSAAQRSIAQRHATQRN